MTATAIPSLHAKLSKPALQHQQLQKQTQKWVAQTFYGNVLKQMHNSPFKDEKFSGGRGGQAFGEMLDQQMADRLSRSSGSKLVNAIVGKIEAALQQRSGKTLMHRRPAKGISPKKPIDIKA